MPLLFIPPTQTVPFDAEHLVAEKKVMEEFRAELAALWQAQPKESISRGAFRGGRVYEWSGPEDALLQTFFIYPTGLSKRTKELARVASLYKKANCQLLGSVVLWGSEWKSELPTGVQQSELMQLKESSTRNFPAQKSPVRLSFEGQSYWATPMAWLSEAFLGEQLAKQGLIVHSDLSGLACFKSLADASGKTQVARVENKEKTQNDSNLQDSANSAGAAADKNAALRRGHRQVRVLLQGRKGKESSRWPLMQGDYKFISLPFNTVSKSVAAKKIPEAPFAPAAVATVISGELLPQLHDLSEQKIRISSRSGRFVTVERGLAFGLKIGMHLTGPEGAKLHVIRFEPRAELDDAAILLIRKESSGKPMAAGDTLELDKTIYPAK